jgi:hypothetical protein
MSKHFKYARYVLRHKWFVFIECCKMGLIHDLSKFSPTEWFPYAENFYGSKPKKRNPDGSYDPLDVAPSFDYAWLSHQHHNPHHWQFWLSMGDRNTQKILKIPNKYAKEMICDWIGAGKAQGFRSPKDDPYKETRAWYNKNMSKMILHERSRDFIEHIIGYEHPEREFIDFKEDISTNNVTE